MIAGNPNFGNTVFFLPLLTSTAIGESHLPHNITDHSFVVDEVYCVMQLTIHGLSKDMFSSGLIVIFCFSSDLLD